MQRKGFWCKEIGLDMIPLYIDSERIIMVLEVLTVLTFRHRATILVIYVQQNTIAVRFTPKITTYCE
jgi:hypothetical protein